jgi:hypothetical protein
MARDLRRLAEQFEDRRAEKIWDALPPTPELAALLRAALEELQGAPPAAAAAAAPGAAAAPPLSAAAAREAEPGLRLLGAVLAYASEAGREPASRDTDLTNDLREAAVAAAAELLRGRGGLALLSALHALRLDGGAGAGAGAGAALRRLVRAGMALEALLLAARTLHLAPRAEFERFREGADGGGGGEDAESADLCLRLLEGAAQAACDGGMRAPEALVRAAGAELDDARGAAGVGAFDDDGGGGGWGDDEDGAGAESSSGLQEARALASRFSALFSLLLLQCMQLHLSAGEAAAEHAKGEMRRLAERAERAGAGAPPLPALPQRTRGLHLSLRAPRPRELYDARFARSALALHPLLAPRRAARLRAVALRLWDCARRALAEDARAEAGVGGGARGPGGGAAPQPPLADAELVRAARASPFAAAVVGAATLLAAQRARLLAALAARAFALDRGHEPGALPAATRAAADEARDDQRAIAARLLLGRAAPPAPELLRLRAARCAALCLPRREEQRGAAGLRTGAGAGAGRPLEDVDLADALDADDAGLGLGLGGADDDDDDGGGGGGGVGDEGDDGSGYGRGYGSGVGGEEGGPGLGLSEEDAQADRALCLASACEFLAGAVGALSASLAPSGAAAAAAEGAARAAGAGAGVGPGLGLGLGGADESAEARAELSLGSEGAGRRQATAEQASVLVGLVSTWRRAPPAADGPWSWPDAQFDAQGDALPQSGGGGGGDLLSDAAEQAQALRAGAEAGGLAAPVLPSKDVALAARAYDSLAQPPHCQLAHQASAPRECPASARARARARAAVLHGADPRD